MESGSNLHLLLKIFIMNNSKRKIIRTVFLGVFTLIAILNVSYGQTKVDKIDELISIYAENRTFNGSVLVAEKGKLK